jgi:hypothetical protein
MSLASESGVSSVFKLFPAILFCLAASVQAAELLSCEKLAELNDAHLQSLSVGMSKDEVFSVMGNGACPGSENPAKTSSFNAGSDAIEVLWYKSTKKSGLTPIYLKNGKYGGPKIGFITSPNSGS